jgi:Pyruvate/2-oxoacid:ferredoxin oxidoreductase delta subunit
MDTIYPIFYAKVKNMKPNKNDNFLEKRLEKYDKWLEAGEIPSASRVVPVRESVEAKQKVMSSEQTLDILRAAETIALTDCECRVHYKRCDNPLEVCFLLDEVAVKNMEKGRGRKISLEEAKNVLRNANEKGLVHLSFYMPGNKIYAFCSCCYCCCHDLQLLRLYDRTDLIVHSSYIAVTDMAACIACGECIDRCLFNARFWQEEKIHYNPELCYGCGLCITVCPEEATVLEQQADSF